MKILVTGGAGFIGSHVVEALIKRNEEVIVIDNLSTGSKDNINLEAAFYKLDINSGIVEEIFKSGIDQVIHLAAQTSVLVSLKDPLLDARANITGSLNLIDLSKKYLVKKFIYINSAAIFGNPQYLPIDENHLTSPISNYGISKNVVEQYLNISGLNFVSLRLANVYGPRQIATAEGGVISIFINNILCGNPLVIEGDGEQTRDFVFVKDVVNAILCSLESGEKECFNIGSGREISILQLIEILNKLHHGDFKPQLTIERKGDIKKCVFNPKKAEERLKWKAEMELKNGLLETINYEKSRKK